MTRRTEARIAANARKAEEEQREQRILILAQQTPYELAEEVLRLSEKLETDVALLQGQMKLVQEELSRAKEALKQQKEAHHETTLRFDGFREACRMLGGQQMPMWMMNPFQIR